MESEKRDYQSPIELNNDFRKLLASAPSVQLGEDRLIFDAPWDGVLDLKHNERVNFRELVGEEYWKINYEPYLYRGDLFFKGFSEAADMLALKRDRLDSRHRADVLMKLSPLLPFIKGTRIFKNFYLPREIRRLMINGISHAGQDHEFYGNDKGGIFDETSVGEIEEKALRKFASEIKTKEFDVVYESTPNYRTIDMGRAWRDEFIERYGRAPNLL